MEDRSKYKANFIKSAIEKAVSGAPDPIITAFCKSYWEMVQDRLPEISMRNPGERKSTWLTFPLPGKPADVYLLHKLREGKVDLHFSKMSGRLSELKARFGAYLVPGMQIYSAGKSGTIHLSVPPLAPTESFDEQKEAAYQGAVAVLRMLRLYESGINNATK